MRNITARPSCHGPAWLGLVMLALCLLGPLPVGAQSFEQPDPEQEVALVADEVTYNAETGQVTARGSVEVYYGDRTLTADEIVYDDTTGRISASGSIVLRDSAGTTVFADAADLDADLHDGLVEGARSLLGPNTRLAAVEGRRIDERYNTLSKAVYSPCKVCPEDPTPLWRIRARRVIHDQEERVIHYENATFDVFGVPVAWVPYFRHPDPTVSRATGFLTPQFRSSSNFGFGLQVPYYWVIDESSDLTLTPFFTTNDGVIVEGEYRREFDTGGFVLAGSLGQSDFDGSEALRGHLDTQGRFDLVDDFDWGWNINFASDDGYLRRFDLSFEDRLTSEVFVERYRRNGFVDGRALYFQSLRDNEPAGVIPRALPAFDARQEFDTLVLGGEVGAFTSGQVLVRNNGADSARFSLGLDWERHETTSWGLALTGFGEVRGDLFNVNDDPVVGDDFTARLTGLGGIEARYPLIWAPGSSVHVIEPVVQFVAAPFGGNSIEIPIEDSIVTEFDEFNVIDRNHFSGIDNFEEGPRFNLAMRYEGAFGDDFKLNATAGRVYRFEDATGFSSESGLSGTESDYVFGWQAAFDPYVTINHRMRVEDDISVARNEFTSIFDVDPVRLSVRYAFFRADPSVDADIDREELTASSSLQLDRNWRVGGSMQRDLVADEFVRVGGSVSYINECCAIDFFVRRRFTDSENAPASTSFGVEVKLLTLGDTDDPS